MQARRAAFACIAIWPFAALSTPTPMAEACSLEIHVDGFRNDKGVLGGAVFKTPAGWPENDSQAFARQAIPVPPNAAAVLKFSDVPPGHYGIVVLHDENGNHRLDRNVFRVPKEGFGFANNPHVGLSAPSWKDASIEVTCPTTNVQIHLIYK